MVTLTREGRDLLEPRRWERDGPERDRQAFHDGIQRPRELKHDLKAEYQEFLQERNRDREDADGRPDRTIDEIREWAEEHHLPCDDQGHVMFPDARIEYELDGLDHTLDVEVMTVHYRGAHASSKARSGFSLSFSGRSGGRGGGRGGVGLAEEMVP